MSYSRQLVLPLEVAVLLPSDSDAVFLRWMLDQLDLRPLENKWSEHLAKRRYRYHLAVLANSAGNAAACRPGAFLSGGSPEAVDWLGECSPLGTPGAAVLEKSSEEKLVSGRPGLGVKELLSVVVYSLCGTCTQAGCRHGRAGRIST